MAAPTNDDQTLPDEQKLQLQYVLSDSMDNIKVFAKRYIQQVESLQGLKLPHEEDEVAFILDKKDKFLTAATDRSGNGREQVEKRRLTHDQKEQQNAADYWVLLPSRVSGICLR